MTPQEKAIELVDKYRIILIQSDTDAGEEILCTTIAKQCVLVAVDEIIPIVEGYEDALSASQQSDELEWWNEVKNEINKL